MSALGQIVRVLEVLNIQHKRELKYQIAKLPSCGFFNWSLGISDNKIWGKYGLFWLSSDLQDLFKIQPGTNQ